MPPGTRFAVAVSYPGDHRRYVRSVCELLAVELGRDAVFVDVFREFEITRPHADEHLFEIYAEQSELVVVFLSADYMNRPWCGLEFRAIETLVDRRLEEQVMLLCLDDGPIEKLPSGDLAVAIGDRSAGDVASLILDRLVRVRSQDRAGGRSRDRSEADRDARSSGHPAPGSTNIGHVIGNVQIGSGNVMDNSVNVRRQDQRRRPPPSRRRVLKEQKRKDDRGEG